MQRKLRTACRLTRAEWGAFLPAWVLLLWVDLGLRLRPFPRLQAWAAPKATAYSHAVSEQAALAEIRLVQAQVNRAARNHLYPMTCLRRSLVSQRMLARRGIPTALRLGVQKEAGALKAHAWLEHEGEAVGEAEDLEEKYYNLLSAKEQAIL